MCGAEQKVLECGRQNHHLTFSSSAESSRELAANDSRFSFSFKNLKKKLLSQKVMCMPVNDFLKKKMVII